MYAVYDIIRNVYISLFLYIYIYMLYVYIYVYMCRYLFFIVLPIVISWPCVLPSDVQGYYALACAWKPLGELSVSESTREQLEANLTAGGLMLFQNELMFF